MDISMGDSWKENRREIRARGLFLLKQMEAKREGYALVSEEALKDKRTEPFNSWWK